MLFLNVPQKAEAIPTSVIADIPAEIKKMRDIIEKIIFGIAKTAAMKSLFSSTISAIGSGSDGKAMFITDWRDAIENQPEKATKIQMENLFETMGAGAGSNYAATDGSGGYVSGMIAGASTSVLDSSIPELINMAEYGVNDPSEVFSGNNMRAFLTAFGSTSKIGNKMEATLFAQDMKNKYQEANRRIAEAQAVANNGFKSKLSGGQVVTPGATIRDLMASAQNASFVSIATAQSIEQVVQALVSRALSTAVKKGIASAKKESGSGSNSGEKTYGTYKDLEGSFGNLSPN